MKTPRENTCGYAYNDPKHERLDESYRGFPIYPRTADQLICLDPDDSEAEAHQMASTFVWDSDSSKAVFADVRDGIMSLVLVTIPTNIKDNPQTFIYPLVGEENVCAGATYCGYNNVSSITFDGDSVKAALIIRPNPGKPIEKDLSIPLWQFVSIGK